MPMQTPDFKTSEIIRRTRSEVIPVFQTSTGSVCDCIFSQEGRVEAVVEKPAPSHEFQGDFVTQGLVDVQVNGFAGIDFNRPGLSADQVDQALIAMAKTGVTTLLPTIITGPTEQMIATLRDLDAAVSASRLGPLMVVGYHIEGPFLSPEEGYSGAHSSDKMSAAGVEFVDALQEVASRPIVIITVAPEIAGVQDIIPQLVARGIRVSIGHSAASCEQIEASVAAGATLSTHLGNGLPHMLHKTDNTIFWQLAQDKLTAMFIADGIHVPRPALRTMLRAKGDDRTILTTDAVSAAGANMAPGAYTLGQTEIELFADGVVRIPGATYLAGSSVTMDQMLRNVVSWYDLPIPQFLRFAQLNPAKLINLASNAIQKDDLAKFVEWRPSPEGPRVNRTYIGPYTVE